MKHGKSVAIVGVGGLFPQSPTLERFWRTISENINTSDLPPQGRWLLEPEELYDPHIGAPDRVNSQRGCFIDDATITPPLDGLAISADFVATLDPMFQLLLQAGHQAFNDGRTETLDRSRVGVIIGNLALPTASASAMARELLGRTFEEQLLGRPVQTSHSDVAPINRYVAGLPAGLLARALELGGPSFTLDAACASSLYAIKLAVEELVSGRADAMLTGGLSRPDSLYTQMGFSQLRAISPSGTCSPFDQKGDGLVVGEGCGIFLLKRTEDAVRASDHIYAVIRGIGLSNDLGGSLLAPASEGQLRAMRTAYQQAGWNPSDVDLIECHATGTPVGDAVEFSSLKSLWGESGWKRQQCVIGSVKSNIGHLLTAAGAAALTKVLLALKEETLPPTAHFQQPAKGISFDDSPFRILQESTPWQRRKEGTPRRAAVSAFGFGGINAHLLLEEWIAPAPSKTSVAFPASFQRSAQPVAIVGLGAHFGPWSNLQAVQQRLFGADSETTSKPPQRWWGAEQSRWFAEAGLKASNFKGYFVDEAAASPGTFRIPPKELEEMLPRQLLMLQVADQALQDASLKGEDLLFTGVFIGSGLDLNATNFSYRWAIQDLARRWAKELGRDLAEEELQHWIAQLREAYGPALSANRVMGALGSIVASRVAKEFRIGGPSFTLSSEENSGLRALEVAVRAIQEGSINRAIVGATDMNGDLRSVLGQHAERPFSASGHCRPFGQEADGTLIGEGAVALVLKRLEDAQQDGDRIYAVIKGVGTATGGASESSIPSDQAIQSALQRALQEARIKPQAISYLETHGSGIAAEDRVEAAALTQVIGAASGESPCWVGSVKPEIGHTGTVSGLASVLRAALSLYHQLLPPFPSQSLEQTPWNSCRRQFIAPAAAQYWLRNRAEGPRRSLVTSLGSDGSSSALVLEGLSGKGKRPSQFLQHPLGALREGLFALAGTTADIQQQINTLEQLRQEHATAGMDHLARLWFLAHPLESTPERCLTLVAASSEELRQQLDFARHWLQEQPERRLDGNGSPSLPAAIRDRLFYAPEPLASRGQMAFIFPGSGNHFAGMGRDLSSRWSNIFRTQDARSQYLIRQYLPQHFWGKELAESIHANHNALVSAQVALGTAVSDLIRSFGIEPQAVSGYSLGESAGLFSFDAWQDREGMSRRLRESTLFTESLAGPCRAAHQTWKLAPEETVDWTICLVPVPAATVRQALGAFPRVYLLIINTYEECVIGGDRQQLEKLVAQLGCPSIPLRGITTVHCEVVDPVAQAYRDLHRFPTTPPEDIRFYSCALGHSYELDEESVADAILSQALATIDYPRLVEQMYADGVRIFLEMGPGNSCSRMISRILKDRPHLTRAACLPGQDAASLILRLLAQCLAEGITVDLHKLYPEAPLPRPEFSGPRIPTLIGGGLFSPPQPALSVPKPAPAQPPATPAVPEAAVITETPAAPSTPEPSVASPPPTATPPGEELPLLKQLEQTVALRADSHAAYLRFSHSLGQAMSENLNLQLNLLQQLLASGQPLPADWQPPSIPDPAVPAPPQAVSPSVAASIQPQFDRSLCLEFAIGSIAKMLGPEFAEVDRFPTRVRLPDEPLMLVDRIIKVEGEARSMTQGRVITEHDVHAERWYLDGGRIPTCVAVEAGQADLFLSGYLGIDFITRGQAVYRLLDAVVTFHRPLPVVGDVINYDIRIERFFRQDQTYLFRFNFEGTVNGEPLLSMKNGCAGFFTATELAAGQGIVHTKLDLMPQPGRLPDDWRPLAPMTIESYNAEQVEAIYRGDLGAAFGAPFSELPIQRPYTLPGGLLKLVDRVIELDPQGGRYGLGQIRAEMDIRPDAWFLTCHFVDDRVMPGTLMYECCMHTLRIYLLRLGWIGADGQTWCEPVPGVDSGLKCRGQVIETTRTVTYQVSIKELGYGPEPFAIVDALMFADGKPIVEITNMSMRLAGLNRQMVEGLWQEAAVTAAPAPATSGKRVLYDSARILAFSNGNPSEAFGEPYRIFDKERKIARLPGPPFQFLDRITAINGEPWKLVTGVTIEAEYDVPTDAWYFAAGRQPEMPFAVLLETGLQPCGWLAAYLGSALTSEVDLRFRNLDGNAVQHRPVTPESGTLTTAVKITRISSSGGMIIQGYDFEIRDAQGPVYSGDTVFGFFSAASLAQQVGVRDAKPYQPSPAEIARTERFPYPEAPPFPEKKLRMVDTIELFVADGGPQGLGFIRGSKQVDPEEWFFKAHFYQDPVCPGSLGLESFLQLLKVVAQRRWGGNADTHFETIALGQRQQWNYRGQIIPSNQEVVIEAVVTSVDDKQKLLKADGYLSVDGKVIYQMKDFSLRLK